ncbi:MAG: UDP-N-acetylmuramoyl-L-alanine--D-glutamate ligase [Planctomycetota bacterium]|nr:UDP-N-acetylmuramoyl-L-alanine--D-glutamate ligase [Planctomycetota bacterium]
MRELSSKRVVVMGLGRFGGGVGVSRFLASRGARVLVTDQAPADDLRGSLAKLAGLPIDYRLGEHRADDFASADLVVINPAVDPRNNPFIQAAVAAGVPLTSEIRLLIDHLPDRGRRRTIGITGSAGKSTTTAMIGHILNARLRAGALSGAEAVHIGGNLGGSLLDRIDTIAPCDWVVLELSSFMLEGMADDTWSPHVAVVTNLAPNHLDRHGTLAEYAAAKQVILEHQTPHDVAILGPLPRGLFHPRTAQVKWLETWSNLVGKLEIPLLIPGEHNQLNARAAIEAVGPAGVDRHDAAAALADFPGLPHRLQFVCEHGGEGGVRYYNDSKATTPEAAELALRAFPPGVVHIILGGYDKGSDLAPLARFASRHCRAIYTLGVTGPAIAAAAAAPELDAASVHGPSVDVPSCGAAGWGPDDRAKVVPCKNLDEAIAHAAGSARRGEVVLLSPACASWDQFENFERRGAAFVEAILKYTGEGCPSPLPGAGVG